MMDQHATCSKCDFQFDGGHSHHTGESECLCIACGSHYGCPTKNRWGPAVGEVIELVRIVTRGKRRKLRTERFPTGVTFIAQREEMPWPSKVIDHLVHYPIDTVSCPECGAATLKLGFADGDRCPKCRDGTIHTVSVEY